MSRQAEVVQVAILGLAVLAAAYLLLTAPPEDQPSGRPSSLSSASPSALFIRNAKIWTAVQGDEDLSDSILVVDDRIVAVGLESSPDMQRRLRQLRLDERTLEVSAYLFYFIYI
jgi:hypothetical protein